MQPGRDDRSLGDLFAELSRDVTALVRNEIELARTEMAQSLARVRMAAIYVASGAGLAYAGLLVLIAALVLILQLAGLTWWASALIVGIVVAVAGGLLIMRGLSMLQAESLAPTQTIETIKENAAWAKGQKTS